MPEAERSPVAPEILLRLREAAGTGGWVDAPDEVAPYLDEQRGRYRGATPAVLRPGTTKAVAEIVRICAETGTPLVPQGGNTGLVGGAVPAPDSTEILLNLGRLNRIREVDAAGGTITAEAGCLLANLQRAAEEVDRLLPLSLGAEGTCQIGGNLATNAGGTQVMRYGSARSLALGLEVVLPDGRIWNGLKRLVKDNAGYDLRDLFIGSEGTLGVITAAVLRLFPRPRQSVTALAAASSVADAVKLYAALAAASGDRMTGCELMSERALAFALHHLPGATAPFSRAHPWTVLMEFHGGAGDDLGAAVESGFAEALELGPALDAIVAQSAAQEQSLWRLRESIPDAQKREGASIKHDISVPTSRMASFTTRADQEVESALPGVRVVVFGHLADGNLHFNLSQPEDMSADVFEANRDRLSRIVHDLAVSEGGSISAEHGIGRMKQADLARYKSAEELDIMRAIKGAIDPRGILNPGKVL
jgi:D-lactate dehydrogenase (cytochrome)